MSSQPQLRMVFAPRILDFLQVAFDFLGRAFAAGVGDAFHEIRLAIHEQGKFSAVSFDGDGGGKRSERRESAGAEESEGEGVSWFFRSGKRKFSEFEELDTGASHLSLTPYS